MPTYRLETDQGRRLTGMRLDAFDWKAGDPGYSTARRWRARK